MSFLCLLLILPTGDERVERLDAGEEAALGLILSSRGEERGVLVERLLDGFEDASLPARRRRALAVAQLADDGDIEGAGSLAGDPDPRVRRSWLDLLGRPDLGSNHGDLRVQALGRMAEGDPDPGLRRGALDALGTLDTEAAVGVLGGLIAALPAPEGAQAATALPETSRSSELVTSLVQPDREPPTSSQVLAAVLPLYGRLLADQGAYPGAGFPIAMALKHPDSGVRQAAAAAFSAVLRRLREQGAEGAQRGDRLLGLLADSGVDPRLAHHHRACLALYPGGDPGTAREAARQVRGGRSGALAGARMLSFDGGDGIGAGLWLFRSFYVEGLAALAHGDPQAARAALISAGEALDGALAERRDLRDSVSHLRHVDLLQNRALVEVGLALAALYSGSEPGDGAVQAHALGAHRLSLEAQVGYAEVHGEALAGWDTLLDSDLSPYRLLFTGVSHPGLGIELAIDLQGRLGCALAAAAPAEMPGFDPPEGLAGALLDPLADPVRRALLETAALARLDELADRIDRLRSRLLRRGGGGWERPEEQLEEIELLERRRQFLRMELASADPDQALRELRIPGSQALWLARDLREEGRGGEARAVARSMQLDLEAAGISRWWYYHGQSLLVRAGLVVGSSYTDEDEPLRAEEALLETVARLEGLERQLSENGAGSAALKPYQSLRASALVSLAVNANVKLGDSEKALAYYEKAYELRRDGFMTVLLACYRARSGRSEEARSLLRLVQPGPQTWYNLACTHALLGDTEVALDWLERELTDNHPSEASRGRQRVWARDDPDLQSLRGDPRFEALVGGG